MRRAVAIAVAAALGLSACAYFNALYNAKRLFAEAETAAARGQTGAADASYTRAIEKAAKSLRKDPDGRWADDALYLIGRAHFARGDAAAARAALERLLRETSDREIATGARAYLGAAIVRLGQPGEALIHLDSAIDQAGRGSDLAAFARLWRARARFALGDEEAAWEDIELAARHKSVMGREARLEWAAKAVQLDQPERAVAAFAALFADRDAHRYADSVHALAARARARWGAERSRALLDAVDESSWPAAARDALRLRRAELLAAAGDTAAAVPLARSVAERAAGSTADRARVLLARWALARAQDVGEMDAVRGLLLPAIADLDARRLLHALRVLAVLLEYPAEIGEPLALFAAAELARDELAAPLIARSLFVSYADLVPSSVWAPKALLAALALAPADDQAEELRRRLDRHVSNAYLVAAWGGEPGPSYESAEDSLSKALTTLRKRANTDAERRDALLVQAVNALDSLRAAARADTVRAACQLVLDSLRVAGIRADSLRAACERGDSLRMDSLLVIDTLLLLRPDSLRGDTLRPDTL
jgi:hypothetical protein